jgi:hypothetical protein
MKKPQKPPSAQFAPSLILQLSAFSIFPNGPNILMLNPALDSLR